MVHGIPSNLVKWACSHKDDQNTRIQLIRPSVISTDSSATRKPLMRSVLNRRVGLLNA